MAIGVSDNLQFPVDERARAVETFQYGPADLFRLEEQGTGLACGLARIERWRDLRQGAWLTPLDLEEALRRGLVVVVVLAR